MVLCELPCINKRGKYKQIILWKLPEEFQYEAILRYGKLLIQADLDMRHYSHRRTNPCEESNHNHSSHAVVHEQRHINIFKEPIQQPLLIGCLRSVLLASLNETTHIEPVSSLPYRIQRQEAYKTRDLQQEVDQ